MSRVPLFLTLALFATSTIAQADPEVSVIATGLVNPRGIAFAPNGQLYVAEAGRGGDGNCTVLGDGATACYGENSAITRIDTRGLREPVRVIDDLPSIAQASGFGAVGAFDIAFLGNGNAQILMGLGAPANSRIGLGPKADWFGRVLRLKHNGQIQAGADIAMFEAVNNPVPGPGEPDSNPYGIEALWGRTLVADAGANAIFEVRANGSIRTFATLDSRMVLAPPFLGLPPGAQIPMQAVPTCVVRGPWGWVYVGQLTGFPFPQGGANIYRIPPWGGTPQVVASGFTNIVDMAFDWYGRLYVLQIGNGASGQAGPPLSPPGKLLRVNHDGSQTLIYDGLFYPGGLAIGFDNKAYVTNFGIVPGPIPGAFPDGGQVLRIKLD